MSDSEKGSERESALKDDVMGVVECVTTIITTNIHRFKSGELRQLYSSPYSLLLLFMISVASA